MPKQFKINQSDLNHVKDWFTDQIRKSRLPMTLSDVDTIHSIDDAQRRIDRDLDPEARKRLQVALAVRRSRKKAKPQVVTQLDDDAREILLKVALSRNVTTSELIKAVFYDEFLNLN